MARVKAKESVEELVLEIPWSAFTPHMNAPLQSAIITALSTRVIAPAASAADRSPRFAAISNVTTEAAKPPARAMTTAQMASAKIDSA